eukprot:scaffold90494_cov19-Tisochrysis_lutea.AAC.1
MSGHSSCGRNGAAVQASSAIHQDLPCSGGHYVLRRSAHRAAAPCRRHPRHVPSVACLHCAPHPPMDGHTNACDTNTCKLRYVEPCPLSDLSHCCKGHHPHTVVVWAVLFIALIQYCMFSPTFVYSQHAHAYTHTHIHTHAHTHAHTHSHVCVSCPGPLRCCHGHLPQAPILQLLTGLQQNDTWYVVADTHDAPQQGMVARGCSCVYRCRVDICTVGCCSLSVSKCMKAGADDESGQR